MPPRYSTHRILTLMSGRRGNRSFLRHVGSIKGFCWLSQHPSAPLHLLGTQILCENKGHYGEPFASFNFCGFLFPFVHGKFFKATSRKRSVSRSSDGARENKRNVKREFGRNDIISEIYSRRMASCQEKVARQSQALKF